MATSKGIILSDGTKVEFEPGDGTVTENKLSDDVKEKLNNGSGSVSSGTTTNPVTFTKMNYTNRQYTTSTDSFDGSSKLNNGTTENPLMLKSATVQMIEEATSQLSEEKVNVPTSGYGVAGQVLSTNGDGTTAWVDVSTVKKYLINLSLRKVSSSSTDASVEEGNAFSTTLTPVDGYSIESVAVVMGSTDITSTAYNSETNAVTIAAVTGNIYITAVASKVTSEILSTFKFKTTGWPEFSEDGAITISQTLYDEPMSGSAYWSIIYPGEISGGTLEIKFNKTVTSGGLDVAVYAVNSDATIAYDSTTQQKNNVMKWYGALSGGGTTYVTADITLEIPDGYYPFIWIRNGGLLLDGETSGGNYVVQQHIYNGDISFVVTDPNASDTDDEDGILTVDSDLLTTYASATTSAVTSVASTTTSGLNTEWATTIETAKNLWMLDANGNIDKIPLIVTTDQHGFFSYGYDKVMTFISEIVDWYQIGQVINLGDTTDLWADADTDNPLTKCASLDTYLDCVACIPNSKRIDVFGNHDTWKNYYIESVLCPQNYLSKYFRNVKARRFDNYGDFVIYDDNYNVKYVCMACYAYDNNLGGYSHQSMHPDGIRAVIKELEKDDGYDVITLSHAALTFTTMTDPIEGDTFQNDALFYYTIKTDALWSARKNKTSGSFTDELGITYSFDFSNCNSDYLCHLCGHMHKDGYAYAGDAVLQESFDCWYASPYAIHFVLVDRENQQLNVWKVDSTPQYQNYQVPFSPTTE